MTLGRGSPLRSGSSRPMSSRGAASVCSVRARTVARASSPHHARQGAHGALREGGPMPTCFVGLDIAKDHIDVSVRPTADRWQANQTDSGIEALVARLVALTPALVVVESTGGYETAVVTALAVAHVPIAVVNPRQVRDFAKALGRLARPDAIDAAVLALFAERVRPEVRWLPDEAHQELVALVTRQRSVARHAHGGAQSPRHRRRSVRPSVQQHVRWLERRIHDADADLTTTIRQSPLWRATDDLLRSVPGIGPITSSLLIRVAAGAGRLVASRDCQSRGCCAAQSGQRPAPRATYRLGRTSLRSRAPVHGHARRHAAQSRDPDLLPPAARRG